MKVTTLGAKLAARLGRSAKTPHATAAAILAGGMMFAGSAKADTLFSEGFDGLTLGPFVSSSESGGDGTDWTDVAPTGWTRDNTTTPTGGPAEFFGFTFMDVDSWIATEGNQDRNAFTKGGIGAHGTVMVADGDAYDDDAGNGSVLGENRGFNAYIQTPSISLDNIAAGSVALNFDSSFRPYEVMTALVDVSFDGGASFTNLLTLNGANSGGDSSLQRANESLSLPIDNPSGGEMIVRFGLIDTDNDWWWAVDNVAVTGNPVPEPSSIALAGLAAAGLAVAARRRK
jgi:hypothetical protein